MKHANLTVTILFLLTGPMSVLAQTPAAPVTPLEAGAAKVAAETAAQPVMDALPTAATAAGTAAVEAQPEPVEPAPAAATAAKTATTTVTQTPAAGTTSADDSGNPCPMHGMGKNRMGKGGDGSGMHGMKHGAGCECMGKGKEKGKRHAEVVQRLDMIEARIAKIEAMLESLMKRASE